MQYWQQFDNAEPDQAAWMDRYPAPMPDGRRLVLPLRDLGEVAVAGFIANQASFAVLDQVAAWTAAAAQRFQAEVVVGLPTLGHTVGSAVARALGHSGWVAPSTTRKRPQAMVRRRPLRPARLHHRPRHRGQRRPAHVARPPAARPLAWPPGPAGGRCHQHRQQRPGRAGAAPRGRHRTRRPGSRHDPGRCLAPHLARIGRGGRSIPHATLPSRARGRHRGMDPYRLSKPLQVCAQIKS